MTVVYLLLGVVVILGGTSLIRSIASTIRETRLNKKKCKATEPSGWFSIIGFVMTFGAFFVLLANFNTPPKYRVGGWVIAIEAIFGLSLIARDIWLYRRFARQTQPSDGGAIP